MGYSTTFVGELEFTKELTASELAEVKKFLGEDCRDHEEWIDADGLYYIDLEFTQNFSGLQWNGAEKTYNLTEIVNMIITNMRQKYPDFGLKGSLLAQGEEIDDRWRLVIGSDGFAKEQKIQIKGKRVTCPHCEEEFILEE